MSFETILYDVENGVATITFNRPDKYNAFNNKQILETTKAFKQAGRDSEVRAIVLTGTGKAFCAGQDLSGIDPESIPFLEHLRDFYNPMILQMRSVEKPVLGAVNGVAAGAGLSAAIACDLRIMSTKASLVFAAFARIGLVPDSGLSYLLPRLVGPAKALELLLFADGEHRMGAGTAVEWGLATKAVAPEDFKAEVKIIAQQLAAMPTRAVGMTKRLLNATWTHNLPDMLDMEAQLQEVAGRTTDAKEGIRAFLDKRAPHFKGE